MNRRSGWRSCALGLALLAMLVHGSGLGSVGWNICFDRAGGVCSASLLESPCCIDSSDAEPASLSGPSVLVCEACVDIHPDTGPITVPPPALADVTGDDAGIAVAWPVDPLFRSQPAHERWSPLRSRAPPLASAVLIARTIILRL